MSEASLEIEGRAGREHGVQGEQGTQESEREGRRSRSRQLDVMVAIGVALLSTFMAICKVKDDNIVQAMQQAQADKLDQWSFYQARNIRHDLAEGQLAQLRIARAGRPESERAQVDAEIARFEALSADETAKKEALKKSAQDDDRRYDALNFRDDQFDLSDALLAIAVAMLAMTALTSQWWLLWLSLLPIGGGVLMGLAGLLGWGLHPDALVKLLS